MIETVDTEEKNLKIEVGNSEIFIDGTKIEDKQDDNLIKIDGNETLLERGANKLIIDASGSTTETGTGTLKLKAGANELDVTPALINLIGAHIFKGFTTLMTAMGPTFFTPAPTPPSAPAPPAGTAPDSDGNPTQVPETTKSNLNITAGTINFTIPSTDRHRYRHRRDPIPSSPRLQPSHSQHNSVLPGAESPLSYQQHHYRRF